MYPRGDKVVQLPYPLFSFLNYKKNNIMKKRTRKSKTNVIDERPIRESKKKTLFQIEPDWKKEWWGMPEFEMRDAQAQYQVILNFMTKEDLLEFREKTGIRVTPKTVSTWYPAQKHLNGEFIYAGKPTESKYPICIPSKGRADVQKTGKILDRMGVTNYKFFVEETEGDWYIEHCGEEHVVVMPFHDLGKGSIPARNFIWDWAKERGCKRHWTVDDNINRFSRCHNNRRICVKGGGFFKAMEDFVDRYENVAMAGPHDEGFVPDRSQKVTPYLLNSRIYSCILLDTSLDYRWRGRYNEDTDLSLRILKDGLCTVLFRALLMSKAPTHSGSYDKQTGAMKGGNTDNVYNKDDRRLSFAKSLQKQHPDVVKITWKHNRWHHHINYRQFKNKLILKDGIVPVKEDDNYGMELVRRNK